MVEEKKLLEKSKLWRWIQPFLSLSKWPLLMVIIAYIIYFSSVYFSDILFPGFKTEIKAILQVLLEIIIPICIYWFFLNIINFIQFQIQIYLKNTHYKNSLFLVSFFINAIKIIVLLSLFSFMINLLPLPEQYTYFTDRIISIFIIAAITSILIRLVKLAEELILIRYKIHEREDLLAHKARTQILIFRRIAITIIIIVAFGAALLLFESVRNVGASILTSAGILSLIAGFAIQRPLRNLVDSLQIIFNQLIKINDLVIVEKEVGSIEEINLYYVVIKIWDLRRLIVPTSYFVENSFINLSRTSTEALGIIKIYVDYTLPVEKARQALKNIADHSPYWDKKTCNLNVTDARESTIELRIDVSASTPKDCWNLQCEIREKLIQFIQENHSHCLPVTRIQINKT